MQKEASAIVADFPLNSNEPDPWDKAIGQIANCQINLTHLNVIMK